jgi:Kef-type K+ transport system membrane component KefB
MPMRILPKQVESLWTLFTAPVVWAAHFLVCYVGAALYCARQDVLPFGFEAVRTGIALATLVALAMIAMSAWLAWRQWGFGTHDPPHDDPTHHDRLLFQGIATLLLSGLSFIAVVFVALPALFITECVR